MLSGVVLGGEGSRSSSPGHYAASASTCPPPPTPPWSSSPSTKDSGEQTAVHGDGPAEPCVVTPPGLVIPGTLCLRPRCLGLSGSDLGDGHVGEPPRAG